MAVKVIFKKRCITDMPYITASTIFRWFKRSIGELGIKINDLDLSTHVALLTFFRTAKFVWLYDICAYHSQEIFFKSKSLRTMYSFNCFSATTLPKCKELGAQYTWKLWFHPWNTLECHPLKCARTLLTIISCHISSHSCKGTPKKVSNLIDFHFSFNMAF